MSFTKEISLFLAALCFAYYYHWNTTDLLWSFWTASFIVGYATIIISAFKLPIEAIKIYKKPDFKAQQAMASVKLAPPLQLILIVLVSSLPGILFIIPFFTIHFGGFHSVHAMFLYEFAPIEGVIIKNPPIVSAIPGFGGFFREFPDVPRLFVLYWPVVLASAINELYNKSENKTKPAQVDGIKPKKNNIFGNMTDPYKNVIKIHTLIFVLAGLKAAKLEGFLVYVVVFTFFFFPFGKIFGGKKKPDSGQA